MAATKAQQEHPATENMKDATVQEVTHGTEATVKLIVVTKKCGMEATAFAILLTIHIAAQEVTKALPETHAMENMKNVVAVPVMGGSMDNATSVRITLMMAGHIIPQNANMAIVIMKQEVNKNAIEQNINVQNAK